MHVIPASFKDSTMLVSSKFRTKNRFPSMTYYDKVSECSIWRSS